VTEGFTQNVSLPLPTPLYELLPSIFRQQDIGQGYPLLALMKVFDHIRSELGAGITDLESDWFIETCPLELVPSIGGLVGVEIAKPVRLEHRALVADTLALRRRRGIAAALPRLVRDSCGWYCLYSETRATPAWSWPLPPVASITSRLLPTSAKGLPPPTPVGWLRVWRLPVFAMVGATPASGEAVHHYLFNPLGLHQPLFNLPGTPLGWAAAPQVTALPAAVNAVMLQADIMRYRQTWPGPAQAPPDSLLYGPVRSLVIRTQSAAGAAWNAVPPSNLRPMLLPGDAAVPPDYPVLFGGAITTSSLTAETCAMLLQFGDASATPEIAVPAAPTMTELVTALQQALASATVVPGTRVSVTAVRAIQVGAVGNSLVLVPVLAASQPLSLAPAVAGGPDPLLLTGSATQGIAAATFPLGPALIAALTGALADSELVFAAPAGQVLTVPLPLVLSAPDPAAVAAAFAAALPTCYVCAANAKVVTVPPPATAAAPAPTPTQLSWNLGLVPAVAIDPDNGVFTWPSAWKLPFAFSVDYGMAMPAAIGGLGLRMLPPVPPTSNAPQDSGSASWLDQQLQLWSQSKAVYTILILQGSSSRTLPAQTIAPAAGQLLWIVAAPGGQAFLPASPPVQIALQGPAMTGAPGVIGLGGLVMEASLSLPGGRLDLTLLDVTLIAAAGASAITAALTQAADDAPAAEGTIVLEAERSLLGPVDLTGFRGTLTIANTVLSAMPAPDFSASVLLTTADMAAQLNRVTLMGTGQTAGTLQATDTLFAGALTCTGTAQFSYCYVADLRYCPTAVPTRPTSDIAPSATAVTRCTTCKKLREIRMRACAIQKLTLDAALDQFCACAEPTDGPPLDCTACGGEACAGKCPLKASGQSWQPVGLAPVFMHPNRYPAPNFARLADINPGAILRGASNRDEIGAYNAAVPTERGDQLEESLRSGLLFGKGLEVVFES
jgi:hypothetical protein